VCCVLFLVFKVIKLDQDTFVEKINLRVGRINLNFSITDVQWHPAEGENNLPIGRDIPETVANHNAFNKYQHLIG